MQTNRKCNRNSHDTEIEATRNDEMAAVTTDVLVGWVVDRGRCVWESTVAGPIPWTGDDNEDRQLAAQMCAGCPVRAECLELEIRTEQEHVDRAWDDLHRLDRDVLQDMWSARLRTDVEATLADEDGAEL